MKSEPEPYFLNKIPPAWKMQYTVHEKPENPGRN
jgi:hypothetical protein